MECFKVWCEEYDETEADARGIQQESSALAAEIWPGITRPAN